jgi:inorganic phosphate transporter, PiT family
MLAWLLLLSALFLAYANGANDNFKGVATLYGSGTLGYRSALALATVATFAGSLCALYLSQGLLANFSGKGLVPPDVLAQPAFLLAVGTGAATTVIFATRLGFPISTTHSLVGGLIGAGVASTGAQVNYAMLGSTFFLPLFVSPFLAFALGAILYRVLKKSAQGFGLTKQSCLCVGQPKRYVPVQVREANSANGVGPSQLATAPAIDAPALTITTAQLDQCVDLYTDRVWGITVQRVLDLGHLLSGATVSFARGLNDTPKIAGLVAVGAVLDIHWNLAAIAVAMALGGILQAARVARTMSQEITPMSHGQGFSANMVTGFLVLVASRFGIPVSTTHVSVGAVFGIGAVTGVANKKVVRSILMSWLITLPVAMGFSALSYSLIA